MKDHFRVDVVATVQFDDQAKDDKIATDNFAKQLYPQLYKFLRDTFGELPHDQMSLKKEKALEGLALKELQKVPGVLVVKGMTLYSEVRDDSNLTAPPTIY